MAKALSVTEEKYRTFAEVYINSGNGSKAAKLAGYAGNAQTLASTASRLLKNRKVIHWIKTLRAEIKRQPVNAAPTDPDPVPTTALCTAIRINTQDKRELLWRIANDCARIVRDEEEISEYVDSEGRLVKVMRVVESMYRPREAIDAIVRLNEMDGDIKTPKDAPPPGAGLNIESLLMLVNAPGR